MFLRIKILDCIDYQWQDAKGPQSSSQVMVDEVMGEEELIRLCKEIPFISRGRLAA